MTASAKKGPIGVRGAAGNTGAQGPAGPQGAAGPFGTQWYEGTGVPSNNVGVIGDIYFDINNGNIYQKTVGAIFVLIANIRGNSP